jgi:hypothetical protein
MNDDEQNLPPVEKRFKPGQSGNPGGKPKNSRNRLTTAFLNALANDFDAHGVKAIRDAREADPVKYMQIVATLMPKQIEQTQPLEDVSDAELIGLLEWARGQIAERVDQVGGTGVGPAH